MKLSQIFGIPTASRDGKTSGYVISVIRHNDVIEGYICCNERETEFFADGKDIIIHKDTLYFKETSKVPKDGKKIRLGYPVYSHQGKFLGHVDDFIIKNDRITHMTVGKKKYAFNGLEIGDVVIVSDARAKTDLVAKDMLIDTVLSMQN